MATRLGKKCMAISMTTVNAMLKESTVMQLKQAINDIGVPLIFKLNIKEKLANHILFHSHFYHQGYIVNCKNVC